MRVDTTQQIEREAEPTVIANGILAQAVETSSRIQVTETLVVALMLVAALVAIAVDRLRVPYTVALVLVGLALGIGGAFTEISLTSDLILLLFLPPLLFEGAINMDLEDLLLRWRQVAVLAIVGTAISALVLAGTLVLVPGLPAELAFLLAVILAATDPVSVLAVFKEHGVGAGLRTLMEGESIFNDALVIVLYLLAVDIAFGDHGVTAQRALTDLGTEVTLGIAAGALVGFGAHRLMSTLDNHLVEITLSLVTAYGSYLLADRVGGSGVIATVMAGLLIGNFGTNVAMSASSRLALIDFWEVVAFLANSALFLVIGIEFDVGDMRGDTLVATAAAIVAILVGRAVIAFGLLRLFAGERAASVPAPWRMAVFWGGLRGSVPIALVLGLSGRSFAGVNSIAVVFGVVLFSLVVQGLSYKPVLDRLGLTARSDEVAGYETLLAEAIGLRAARRELEDLRRGGELAPVVHDVLRDELDERLSSAEERLSGLSRDLESVRQRQGRLAAHRLATAQKRAISEAVRRGRIGDEVARGYIHDLDVARESGDVHQAIRAEADPGLYPEATLDLDGGGPRPEDQST